MQITWFGHSGFRIEIEGAVLLIDPWLGGNPLFPSERRAERLATPTPDDNRITHGCINVSPEFYEQVVRPTFERGGVFYILPDKASIEETFPEFAQSRTRTGSGSHSP